MTVRFSCRCPNTDYLGFEASPEAIVAAAKKAEALGYDAIFANDHIIVGSDARSAAWTNCYDPLVALAYMGAATSRIRIGVSVLIVALPQPDRDREALATIDRMSGGRLIAGVGVEVETPRARIRGARRAVGRTAARGPTQYLPRLAGLAEGPDQGVVQRGRVRAVQPEMFVSPKPLQQPHPPFWSGGFSDGGDAAMRRSSRRCNRQPTPMPAADLVERIAALKKASEAIGRATPPETRMSFRVDFGKSSVADVVADLSRYRETAGLDAFQVNFHGNPRPRPAPQIDGAVRQPR